MSVLDQSFSAKNFEVIFNMLNRMGKMKITNLSFSNELCYIF